jgi:predicted HD phosphohydrolase
MDHVKFSNLKEGDEEDFLFLIEHDKSYAGEVGDRLMATMASLDDSFSSLKVSRLEHSLQTATRAWHDGADIDWVVCSLLHDIGDIHAPYNHDEYAAVILRPFVREQCAWAVQVHGVFQAYYFAGKVGGNPDARDVHRDSPYFDDCADFCERWDQASFDPGYESLPLKFFKPMVDEVFAREAHAPDVVRPGVRVSLVDPAVAAERAAH